MKKLMTKYFSISALLIALCLFTVACSQDTNTQSSSSGGSSSEAPSNNDNGESKSSEETITVNIGTNGMGSTFNTVASSVSTVVGKHSPVQMKVMGLSGALEWFPMMDSKEIDIGTVGDYEAWAALHGKEIFDQMTNGEGYNIRLIASGNRLRATSLVEKDSDIRGPEDIKGKRYTLTYGASGLSPLKQPYSYLANLNIDPSEVNDVPLNSPSSDGPKALMEGRVDIASSVSVTATGVEELEATKGARFISLDGSPEAIARGKEIFPTFDVELLEAGSYTGIVEDTYVLSYPIYLVAREDVSDEVIYEIVKAMWEKNDELTSGAKPMDEWTTDKYVIDKAAIPYHPGAVKFYKEVNAWDSDMDAKQQELLDEIQ